MEVYTIGFTRKTAEEFFQALSRAGIRRVMDIRLNNSSQLAGFSKRDDLPYFLHKICDAEYIHEPLLAPTQETLDAFKKQRGSWADFSRRFIGLLTDRKVEEKIDPALFSVPTALLCSEPTPDRCHRRLVAEYLASKWPGLTVAHL